jgi:hypothetical protein
VYCDLREADFVSGLTSLGAAGNFFQRCMVLEFVSSPFCPISPVEVSSHHSRTGIVALMACVVMPHLTRWANAWLYR